MKITIYVAAETAEEALSVCQSPACRNKKQVRELVKRMSKHKIMRGMIAWKLTIHAEPEKPTGEGSR